MDIASIVAQANAAANQASKLWLLQAQQATPDATVFDSKYGRMHIILKSLTHVQSFDDAGAIDDHGCIKVDYLLQDRQELTLHEVAVRAALEVYRAAGIVSTLRANYYG